MPELSNKPPDAPSLASPLEMLTLPLVDALADVRDTLPLFSVAEPLTRDKSPPRVAPLPAPMLTSPPAAIEEWLDDG